MRQTADRDPLSAADPASPVTKSGQSQKELLQQLALRVFPLLPMFGAFLKRPGSRLKTIEALLLHGRGHGAPYWKPSRANRLQTRNSCYVRLLTILLH